MNKNKDISDELQKLSPLLEDLRKDIEGPSAPPEFFDHLKANVFAAISQIPNEDALTETAKISPVLAALKKEDQTPLAPEGYYNEMRENVLQHTLQENSRKSAANVPQVSSGPKIIRMFLAISAAAAVIIAVATTLNWFQKPVSTPAQAIVQPETELPANTAAANPVYNNIAAERSPQPIALVSKKAAAVKQAEPVISNTEENVSRGDILNYLIENPADLNAQSIVDELGLTASVSFSETELNDLNDYLYDNIEGLDEYELIKTTL